MHFTPTFYRAAAICSSGTAIVGLLGFTLWAFTEAGQQTLTCSPSIGGEQRG
jgi:hypothetical protein